MNFTYRAVFLSTLLLVGSAEAAVKSGALAVATDEATGRSSLQDRRSDIHWDLGKVQESVLADDGRSVIIRSAVASGKETRLLEAALTITAEESGYALVPDREGLLIPADGPVEFTHRFGTSSYEGCHMNMIGFVKQGAALLMTWDDPYITPELKKNKQGLACSVLVRRAPSADDSASSWIKLTPLGKGDWNTVAAAYRKMAETKGLAVTFRDKVKRNPEAAKLAGASNAKLWMCLGRRRNRESTKDESVSVNWTFEEAAKIAEHMKNDLGIGRCLFTVGGWTEGGYDCRHPDALPANAECGGNDALADAVRRIKALGYLACFHDNYQDMYRDAKSWNPDFIQKKKDGSLMAGGQWMGGLAYLVCAPKTLELAQRPQNLTAVQKLFGPQAYFIDTTYAVGPQECFDPNHPLGFADDIRWKQKLSDYSRDVFGLFGSECGREWAIAHSDFFEGLSGVSGKYYHNLEPATLGATVVPLFEMVYHDCEAVYGKYGYNPDAAAEYVAHHVLCARPLNYHSIPNHLYWKEPVGAGSVSVPARPSVVSVEPIGPRKFRIKYRWQVDADCSGDWHIFVHFGAKEPVPFQNDHPPVRPCSTWHAGDLIEEGPFEVTVPDSVTASSVEVLVGMYRQNSAGGERAVLPGSRSDMRVLLGRLQLKPAIAFEKAEPRPTVGDPACFVRADQGWAEGLCRTDRFLKNTHEILSPLNELTANARITKLEFLTPDRSVRRVAFTEKSDKLVATVTVNFGAADYVVTSKPGKSVTLPANGFLIESPQFTAFHATSWAGRQYEKPVLFTVRRVGRQTVIFHGFGDPHLTWRGKELTVARSAEVKE